MEDRLQLLSAELAHTVMHQLEWTFQALHSTPAHQHIRGLRPLLRVIGVIRRTRSNAEEALSRVEVHFFSAESLASDRVVRYNNFMTAEHFDRTLQAYQKRRPFRSFCVRFISGEHIDVDHPEALVIRSGVGVYVSAKGVPTLFDHESVSEVVGKNGRRGA